jgi:hypothetical protein
MRANIAEPHRASFCATRLRAFLRQLAKMRAKTVRQPPTIRLGFKLLGRTIAPMLTSDIMSRAAVGAMMRKSKHLPRVVDQRAERESTFTPQQTDIPDPRLVELVRLLARRAAKRWYEKTIKARRARPL